MNKRHFLIIILFISVAVSCKSNKNLTKANNTAVLKTATTANDSTMRFIVSFYSIGSGTETDQIKMLKSFISQYGKNKSINMYYSTASWGKEGEIDFCFPLKELSASDQNDFIINAKNVLKGGKWIHYFENQPCRKRN